MTTADHLRIIARLLEVERGHTVTVPRESLEAVVDMAAIVVMAQRAGGGTIMARAETIHDGVGRKERELG